MGRGATINGVKIGQSAVTFEEAEGMLERSSQDRLAGFPVILSFDGRHWVVSYDRGGSWKFLAHRSAPAGVLNERIEAAIRTDENGCGLPVWDDYGPDVIDVHELEEAAAEEDGAGTLWDFVLVNETADGSIVVSVPASDNDEEHGCVSVVSMTADRDSMLGQWFEEIVWGPCPGGGEPGHGKRVDGLSDAAVEAMGECCDLSKYLSLAEQNIGSLGDIGESVDGAVVQIHEPSEGPVEVRTTHILSAGEWVPAGEDCYWATAASIADWDEDDGLDRAILDYLDYLRYGAADDSGGPPHEDCACAECMRAYLLSIAGYRTLADLCSESVTELGAVHDKVSRVRDWTATDDHENHTLASEARRAVNDFGEVVSTVSMPSFSFNAAFSSIPCAGQRYAGFGCDAGEATRDTLLKALRSLTAQAAAMAIAGISSECLRDLDGDGKSEMDAERRKELCATVKSLVSRLGSGDALGKAASDLGACLQLRSGAGMGETAAAALEAAVDYLFGVVGETLYGPLAGIGSRRTWSSIGGHAWSIKSGDDMPALIAMPENGENGAVLMMRPALEGPLSDGWEVSGLSEEWAEICAGLGVGTTMAPLGHSYETCSRCKCPLTAEGSDTAVTCPNCGHAVVTKDIGEMRSAEAVISLFGSDDELDRLAGSAEGPFIEWTERLRQSL